MRVPKRNYKKEVSKYKIADLSKAERAYYQKTDFTWGLELFIDSTSPITRIVSFSHNINTELIDEEMT